MKTLITGATGFLGNSMVKRFFKDFKKSGINPKEQLILIGHSEKRADSLRVEYNIPVLVGDIQNEVFLDNIFRSNDIKRVIHAAAIKYISISNDNPTSTVETNVIGSYNLIKLSKRYGVKEVVGISTDKAINPISVYGMSKRLMEVMFLEAGYTIVSGVNFFGSSGSVLDVWYSQMKKDMPLTITDRRCIRYAVHVDEMTDLVFSAFGHNKIFFNESVIKIEMGLLLKSFLNVFNYDKFKEIGLLEGEKLIEEIPSEMKVLDSDEDYLVSLIKEWSSINK